MKNSDFYILHLSDLHIKNTGSRKGNGSTYSNSLDKLITDIVQQTDKINNLIIVISGDIIDQGKYEQHKDAAIKFFKKLRMQLGDKNYKLVIVPGNHDKIRSNVNSLISRSHMEVDLKLENNEHCEEEWQVYKDSYKGYFELVNEIYNIFQVNEKINNSFYVKLISVDDINICFICVDSAWCSYTENDNRKLRVGDYQLKKLNEEYKLIKSNLENEGNDIDLTIAVSHFPLNWLNSDEEKLCNDYFLSDDFLNVDILMCGHVHDFSVVNYFNHTHSLLTLVTGIGWGIDNPSEERNQNHRYSLYTLNLFYNSCDILMRKSKSDGVFDYDYSVYAGEHEIRDNKLRYPLKVKESNAYIRVNSLYPSDTKSIFIDNALLEIIPSVSKHISLFSTNISGVYSRYKDALIKKILLNIFPEYNSTDISTSDSDDRRMQYREILDALNDYFYYDGELPENLKNSLKGVDKIYNFCGFLHEICTSTVTELSDCFSKSTFLRAHFRWYNNNDEFPMLCQYSNLPEEEKSNKMQLLKWGGLIEVAFKTREPIVYSANKIYNLINTSWDDFITIIPTFSNFSQDIRIGKKKIESRPILTFGISIKNPEKKQDYLVLYLLGFLRFDQVLTAIIDDYMRLFTISSEDFLSGINDIKNNKD